MKDIDSSRPNSKLLTPWYRRVGNAVFETMYSALGDFCEPDRWAGIMPVVGAPVGSGESSYALAFIVALTRLAETKPWVTPSGILLVIEQKADKVYRELVSLLGERAVAI